MKEQLPSKTKERITEGVTMLEKAIRNVETKNSIENVIQSYSKIDKNIQWSKQSYLVECLGSLCGAAGTEIIINLLTRGASSGALRLIEDIKNPEVKAFLKETVLKYGAQYQWFLEPLQKDWERYEFSTRYLGVPPFPVISAKIVCKSGQLLELESPLTTYGKLVVAQVEHLKSIDDDMKKLGSPKTVQKILGKNQLEKLKRIVDELLEKDSDSS